MTAGSHASSADESSDGLVYLAGGPLAAVLIGMALVPLRSFTSASNFSFVFLLLTIVVAEFGGRRAALATAVAATMSLDFFLTEPYFSSTPCAARCPSWPCRFGTSREAFWRRPGTWPRGPRPGRS